MLNPSLNYVGTKARVGFTRDCSKQEKLKNSKHLHYLWKRRLPNISSYPTLENCLFGAVKLAKHVEINL